MATMTYDNALGTAAAVLAGASQCNKRTPTPETAILYHAVIVPESSRVLLYDPARIEGTLGQMDWQMREQVSGQLRNRAQYQIRGSLDSVLGTLGAAGAIVPERSSPGMKNCAFYGATLKDERKFRDLFSEPDYWD